jgi:hypothetical protein
VANRWLAVTLAASIAGAVLTAAPDVARADRIDTLGAARFTAVDVDPASGRVAVTGWRRAIGPHENAIVRVYGPAGALLWSRKWVPPVSPMFGAHGNGYAEAVSFGPGGTVYVGGAVAAACEGGGWFLRAYGRDGALRWHREQAGWKECAVSTKVTAIATDAERVIVGMQDFGCCGMPDTDGFIRAFDHGGRALWTGPFEPPGIPVAANDGLTDLAIGGLGRIYAVGTAYHRPFSDTGGDIPDSDVMVQKLAPSGATIWTRVLPDAGAPDSDVATSISVRGDRVVVGALTELRRWAWPATWIGRFTFGGEIVWSRRIATKAWAQPHVSVGSGGATYLAGGWRGDDLVVRRYGPTGSLDWQQILGRGTRVEMWPSAVATRVTGPGAWLTITTYRPSDDRTTGELRLVRR